jgi:hypothetical protein
MNPIFTLLLLPFLFLGCFSPPPPPPPPGPPYWTEDPGSYPAVQGKNYGLGISKRHVSGLLSKQRELAISKATTEIAQQGEVTANVHSEVTVNVDSEAGSTSRSKTDSNIVSRRDVKTKILEEYYDTRNKIFYVLLVEE